MTSVAGRVGAPASCSKRSTVGTYEPAGFVIPERFPGRATWHWHGSSPQRGLGAPASSGHGEVEHEMDRYLARLLRSPAVLSLIGVNIAVFVAQLIRNAVAGALVLQAGEAVIERPWTLVTVMFLHEHLAHLALLVVVLLAFGISLERRTGARHLVLIYLAAGFVGSLVIVLVAGGFGWDERMVGSSAAFHGIIAAFVALRPDATVLGSPAKTWLLALIVINLVLMVPTGFGTPLSSAAHLMGLAVGFLYGRQLLSAGVVAAETVSSEVAVDGHRGQRD
jgi:membrane associated rhomboid family serine protease